MSYHYIPVSPLDMCFAIKRIIETHPDMSFEKLEKKIEKPEGYIKILFYIEKSYAKGIKRFIDTNKIDIEEASKVLEISIEKINKYMEFLDN